MPPSALELAMPTQQEVYAFFSLCACWAWKTDGVVYHPRFVSFCPLAQAFCPTLATPKKYRDYQICGCIGQCDFSLLNLLSQYDLSGRALGCLDFDLDVPSSCQASQPILPNLCLPKQNLVDSVTQEG